MDQRNQLNQLKPLKELNLMDRFLEDLSLRGTSSGNSPVICHRALARGDQRRRGGCRSYGIYGTAFDHYLREKGLPALSAANGKGS